MIPDYPPVIRPHEEIDGAWNAGVLVRPRPFLIHTRKQAEAGKIYVAGKRLPHEGVVNDGEKPVVPRPR